MAVAAGLGIPGSEGGVDVALVGRERQGDENLALRYLASAVEQAGGHAEIFGLFEPWLLVETARRVAACRPLLVGVSMSDSDAAIDSLAFAVALRRAGYRGHITAGGAVATLGRHELLKRHRELDSVIRQAGEVPIVELYQRLAEQRSVDDVPGITSRRGDGPPAPVLDPLPLRLWPKRPERLPELLGVPMARLLASRGCPGRCRYCGPAALQRSAVEEGLAAGISAERLRCAGVGGTRRRPPEDVAAEVAELHHGRGARFFHLLDDNLLSSGPEEAAAWLDAVTAEMRRRGVKSVAFSLQIESTTITPQVASALESLGVVRVALGVESLTEDGLRNLGRAGQPVGKRAALEELRQRGIVTVFNSLLVHPRATALSIEQELAALGDLEGFHFDAVALAVYHGTDIWRDLCDSGRLDGGLLASRYVPTDLAVRRFRAALIRLRLGAIGRYGANVLAHDVAVNLAIARRLRLPAYDATREQRLQGALHSVNAIRVRAWQQLLALGALDLGAGEYTAAVEAVVARVSRELAPVFRYLTDLQACLESASASAGEHGERSKGSGLLVRSSLAATFSLLMAGSTVACGGETGDSSLGTETGGATPASGGSTGMVGSGGTGTGGATSGTGGASAACSAEAKSAEQQRALDWVDCPGCTASNEPYGLVVDQYGHVVNVIIGLGYPAAAEVRDCYVQGLSGEVFPCLSGEEIWNECLVCLF